MERDCDAAKGTLDDALQIVAARSDFNGDAQVDFLDYVELANIWGWSCPPPDWCDGIDIDNSTRVDFGDLAVLAQEWLLGV